MAGTFSHPKQLLPLDGEATDSMFRNSNLFRQIQYVRELGIEPHVVHRGGATQELCNALTVNNCVADPQGEAYAVKIGVDEFIDSSASHVLIWSGDNVINRGDVQMVVRTGMDLRNVIATSYGCPNPSYTCLEVRQDAPTQFAISKLRRSQLREPQFIKLGLYMFELEALRSALSAPAKDDSEEWSMDTLVEGIISDGTPIYAAPIEGCFHDIGTPASYYEAIRCPRCTE